MGALRKVATITRMTEKSSLWQPRIGLLPFLLVFSQAVDFNLVLSLSLIHWEDMFVYQQALETNPKNSGKFFRVVWG